ncbi:MULTISPECIES: AAA family ATPase [Actinoalloteichus]|uniref:ATPase family protein associated with various cellular activities (AAA) n=1 Tax=Actinoalloteichus fjordicus TaxID=1612552 RepID=A0AAC9LCW0_9PSEU|nr:MULTISPECIES: AAA family ATPase [Actinoalloteichus]APU15282.1 ATPase family protein associated with various cellular activities (AAA) [Actinoalloteichus fjordicus]APU21327.1 ATPase family protein associated with various cellular activities (AAA) [Actinoalloteichus sp. GBA129-24]
MTTAPPPPVPSATSAATVPRPAGARLRSGELRRQVAAVLADQTEVDHTPRTVALALGRSAGAVANALAVLVDRGEAAQTSTTPVRFRANAATAAAATAAHTGGSGSPRRSRATAPPAPATGAGVVSGPVTRPNGQTYHPRTVAGMPDVTALRRLREAGVPALLYGPPGTGKTSVVEAAFPDLITVAGDGDTTVADFVGEYTQTPDGRYVFVHGPLIRAMRAGLPLFIDDATLIPPTVLAVVYPAMDGRREIVVKAYGGEVVHAAPGFYTIAGHNPGVHGAVLSDALASRFAVQIQVSTDYDLATQLEIDRRAVRVARNLAARQARGEVGWAPQLRELIAFQRIADVLGSDAAAGNLIGAAPEEDRDTVGLVVRGVFGKPLEPLALGARI